MSLDNDIYEKKIKLSANEVKAFVNEATKCNFDVDVFYNHYAVDAKSILGVLALDLTKILTVRMFGYDDQFDSFLNGHAVAC